MLVSMAALARHCLKTSREGDFTTVARRPFQGLVWPRETTAGMPGFVTAGTSAGMGVLCTLQISVLGHSGYVLVMCIVWQGCVLGRSVSCTS